MRRLQNILRFKKPDNLAESNHHYSSQHRQTGNRPSSNNINCSIASDQAAKKSVSLQVPDRLLVGADLSSTSSHATAFSPCSPGAAGCGGGGGTETPASTAATTIATTSTSASALSLAARRLSEIRLPKKFFPSTSLSNRPTAIELEDDDVPVRIPPRLSAHSYHNEYV